MEEKEPGSGKADAVAEEEGATAFDLAEEEDELWANPLVTYPGGLSQRMVRVDLDIFDWFYSQGEDFEARINKVLREFMQKQG